MMKCFIKIVYPAFVSRFLSILVIIVVGITSNVHAQLYPIQVVTEITPPYSIYLSDYTTVGSSKLNLNLLLTDVTRFNYPVKFKLIIEGEGITITTSASYMPEQIILDGGSPLRLSGDELAAYFNPKNLDFKGYSKEKFNQTGALPEGIYRIGFQVFDYNKNIAVSSFGAATAWLVLNDPPMFNIPEKNVKLTASEPQNIMFQWMPRHLGSPNSAFNAEYVFQLYEIWPDGRNPNEVVASTQPLIENTGASTTLLYSNTTQTPLIPGRQYAYRVQAKDVEGRDLFRNHGYSEVQMFTYGDPCDVPTQIEAQNSSSGNIIVNWQATAFNTSFYVQYREANNPTAEWFPKNTYTSTATLTGLKPEMKYEYQVRGVCGAVNSDFSDLLYISTPKMREPKVICGQLDSAVIITNHVPCTSLLPGDIITTGKFATQVTQASGGSGKWTGEGFMHVPLLGTKVHVMFKNISINEKLQVTSGRVESVYNISNKFDNKPTPASKTDSTKQVTPHVPAVRDTIVVNAVDTIYKAPNGDVKVVDNNGDTTTIHRNIDGSGVIISAQGDSTVVKAGDPVVIKDNNGNTTVVDRDGNITNLLNELATEEDKPIALVDRNVLLYITVAGRTDTLCNGHTLYLPSQDTTIKLTMGYRDKDLYTKAYRTLNLKNIKNVKIPMPHWADSINTNLTQWNHVSGNTTGKDYLLNLRKSGSSKLKIDASNALNVIFTHEPNIVTHARKDTLIRGSKINENKIEVNINITEPGTLLFKPKDDNYYLDYGFDDANFTQCQQSNDYEKLTIAKADYYVPWLGVLPNTEAEIKLEYQSKDVAQDSMIILECVSGKLRMDSKLYKIEYNYFNTKNIFIKTEDVGTYYINAYSLNKQKVKTRIGKLKVESKNYDDSKKKSVRIICLKRSDENTYPVVNKQLMINEINDQGYKQAFIRFELDNSPYTDTLTITKSSNDSVKLAWLDQKVQNLTTTSEIYYIFIVSKGKNRNDGEGHLGGTKKELILLGTTHYLIATHELGHNLGLPHTWEKKGDGVKNVFNYGNRILIPQFSTKNIMDYRYSSDPEHRRYFFLFQINHLKNQ